MKTVCILGGGLGGLMTGALLAKEGYRITVLEKNAVIGGGLQSFRRGRFTFDTGMHVFGGMGKDGQLRRVLRHLGIEDKVEVVPRVDTLVDVSSGKQTELPFGREAYIKEYPLLEPYIKKLGSLTNMEPLFNMRPLADSHTQPDLTLSVGELLKTTDMGKLNNVLPYLTLFYDGRADSPAILHALISLSHIDGAYSFKRNSIELVKALTGVIEANGGEIHCGEEVTAVEVENREITCVRTPKGEYKADIYINDMPIGRLLEIVSPKAFPPAFRNRIGNAPYTNSALTIFIGLKPNTVKYNSSAYFAVHTDTPVWSVTDCPAEQWPRAAFVLPTEDEEHPGYAKSIKMVCNMKYDYVRQWETSRTGHRPDEYYRWKERMTGQALQLAEHIGFGFPLSEAIEYIDAGSPLTIRDYYGTPQGALYGIRPSSSNPMLTSLLPTTRLANLFLTGQDVNFHGMVGTTLTSIITTEAVVGRNVIVNQIINEEKQTI